MQQCPRGDLIEGDIAAEQIAIEIAGRRVHFEGAGIKGNSVGLNGMGNGTNSKGIQDMGMMGSVGKAYRAQFLFFLSRVVRGTYTDSMP